LSKLHIIANCTGSIAAYDIQITIISY
jgi:hypothetical protein